MDASLKICFGSRSARQNPNFEAFSTCGEIEHGYIRPTDQDFDDEGAGEGAGEGGECDANGEAGGANAAHACNSDCGGSAGQLAEAGTDGDQWWDEHAAPPPRKEVRKIKSHHTYSSGAQEGSLATVYMSMEFADGTPNTGRGGYIPSEPYLADEGFRAALRRYDYCHQER